MAAHITNEANHQIDITEIVIHEAEKPDAVIDFLEADGLSG